MSREFISSEERPVSGFRRVSLRAQHQNELAIVQGAEEKLHVEAPEEILPRIVTEVRGDLLVIETGGGLFDRIGDALTTSLTRPRLKYTLTVKELQQLEVYAMARVRVGDISADEFTLRFRGAGEIDIDAVLAGELRVDLPGAGRIKLAGRVGRQQVSISGPGEYLAQHLESRSATVTVKGVGRATVWAVKELDVTIRGVGTVTYLGAPRVRHSLSPVGRLVHLN